MFYLKCNFFFNFLKSSSCIVRMPWGLFHIENISFMFCDFLISQTQYKKNIRFNYIFFYYIFNFCYFLQGILQVIDINNDLIFYVQLRTLPSKPSDFVQIYTYETQASIFTKGINQFNFDSIEHTLTSISFSSRINV